MQVYRHGDRGPGVVDLRAKLSRLGLLPADETDLFDDAVDRAVRTLQQRRGLRVDGVVGPETYRALDEAHSRLGDPLLGYLVPHPLLGGGGPPPPPRPVRVGLR